MQQVKDPTICPYCGGQGKKDKETEADASESTYILICEKCGAVGGTSDGGASVLWGDKDEEQPHILLKVEE